LRLYFPSLTRTGFICDEPTVFAGVPTSDAFNFRYDCCKMEMDRCAMCPSVAAAGIA
jgi:hypothetical protein